MAAGFPKHTAFCLQERHRKLFKPPLPEAKAAAIQRLGIGVVDKVFITFQPDPAAPQPELTNSCNLFWQADAKDLLPGMADALTAVALSQTLALHNAKL